MRFLLINFTLFSILITSNAFSATSGNRVGNGGNAVTCRVQGKITKIELLDFYEKTTELLPASSGKKENPPKIDLTLLTEQLTLLGKIHPRLSEQFLRRSREITGEIGFKDEIKLVDVADSFHAITPKEKDCQVEQAAVRQEITTSEDPRFLFQSEIWAAFSPKSKAGLLSHEIIYEYFYKLGERDSRKARIYNAMLWSKDFAKLTAPEYWKKIRELKLAIYD